METCHPDAQPRVPLAPTRPQGKENLFKKQVKLAAYGPMFCDITWGAGGSTADATLDIAASMQNKVVPPARRSPPPARP